MMKRVLGIIWCDLDTKVKVTGKKAGICDGIPSTAALFVTLFAYLFIFVGVFYIKTINEGRLRNAWL